MTTFGEVAQALATAGYLSEADVEAAAVVLADAIGIEDAKRQEADASRDEAAQQELIAGLQIEASTDAAIGDFVGQQVAEDLIAKARTKEEEDEAIIENAEAIIAFAYQNAAAALLAADLIDRGDRDAVVDIVATVWESEED